MIEGRCTDDELRAIESSDPNPCARRAAAELLQIRSERRRDSRRAEQVKKLRWAVENAISKIEAFPDLAKQWEDEALAPGHSPGHSPELGQRP